MLYLGQQVPTLAYVVLKNTRFRNKAMFNMAAEFSSIEQRLSILRITESWHKSEEEGNLVPFDTMKV